MQNRLPAVKFSRMQDARGEPWLRPTKVLLTALLLFLAHVLTIAGMKESHAGAILSDCLILALAAVAAFSGFQAAARSHNLARAFWYLSGCSFTLWALAFSLDLLFLTHISPTVNALAHLFSFVAFVPMLVTVFVVDYRDDEPIGMEVLLDAMQLLLLVISVYGFFILIPESQFGTAAMAALGLALLNLRNIVLAAGLAGRAIFTRSSTSRRLYGPMAVVMSLFMIGSWMANHGAPFDDKLSNPLWLNLGWSLPAALMVVIATQWQEAIEPTSPAGNRHRISSLVLVYAPSIIFPIALYLKFATIMQWQVFLGLATMLVSLVLYTLRLVLLQGRQNKVIQKLAQSSARYQSLFERNVAAVYRSTIDGALIDFNSAFAKMLGYTREELLQLPMEQLYRGGAQERALRIEQLKENPQDARYEFEFVRKDGKPLWVVREASIVEDEDGNQVIEGTMLDVTERHFLELQLRQAQKMEAIGRLAGGVAHDFNNLLTIIISYSDMLTDLPDPRVAGYAEQIKAAGNRAASMTRQLLAFSRQQVMNQQAVNLNAVLKSLQDMLLRLIGENITVRTLTANDLGSVQADTGQLEQVVMNLVLNARDAMPNGGILTLETANLDLTERYVNSNHEIQPGHYVQLTISDTGVGMDEETLSHIFEPFYTTKAVGQGTGLGLSTVYGIVKQSGGHIWAYSEPGCGATFKLLLPRVDQQPITSEHEQKSLNEHRGSETILVVEDDPILRNLTKAILAARGYRVLTAATAEEVEAACRGVGYTLDLLLTDVVMPGKGGREIAAQVLACCPKVKVLYMSGYASFAISQIGALEPGITLLQKPFTPTSMAAKVREVLDGTSTG